MADTSTTVRREQAFAGTERATLQVMQSGKVRLLFPPSATFTPHRSAFHDEKDLRAFLSEVFLTGLADGERIHVQRRGRYHRVDEQGRVLFTFGDPVLDLITDPEGRTRVGDELIDFRALVLLGGSKR